MTWLPLLILALAQSLPPMAKDANPAFEVATIKHADPASRNQGFHQDGHRISIENETVRSLIMFAYGIHRKQIIALPDWAENESWDINGVPDAPGEPSISQYQTLVRKLLEDRFALAFHRDKRDLPIYALTVAKGGAKLTPSTAPPDALIDQTGSGNSHEQTMHFTNNTMDDFALGMQYFVGRPVINQTGLTGRFNFTLRWSVDEAPAADAAAPSMFTAIQEQLGLKLEATHGIAPILIIDHLERPSEN